MANAILLMIVSNLITGFMFVSLWMWFIVPVFHVQAISVPQALGIAITIRFLTWVRSEPDSRPFGEQMFDMWVWAIGHPVLTLIFALIYRMFL